MLFQIILLIVGFVLLTKGADFLVDSAAGIAGKLKIPQIIIGLTIVAMGTSAPEAAVSIQASLRNQSSMSIGNVLGSNIINILLILGLTALFKAINVQRDTVIIEIPFLAVMTLVFPFMGMKGNLISRSDGCILLLAFALFMGYTVVKTLKDNTQDEEEEEQKNHSIVFLLIFLVLGIAMVIYGSDLIVGAASYIAKALGMTDRLIGLTIVAFGTSLPELVTSLTALKKENPDMAIGNIVGSNIFNLLFIVGLSSVIRPLEFSAVFLLDCGVALLAIILLLISVLDRKIGRIDGIIFLVCYAVYTGYIIMG